MGVRIDIRTRLESCAGMVAAEMAARDIENRRWTGDWPVPWSYPHSPARRRVHDAYRVREFELPAALCDGVYSPYDGDLVDFAEQWADSADEVEAIVGRSVDLATLDYPWRVDGFPL